MLETLHSIVKAVNTAPDLEKALHTIVDRVKEAIDCDVCSVYLTDSDARTHVLAATNGLRQEAVGKVALPLGRGLVGLVAERAEPLNLSDAPSHPRYLRIVETGETQYRGFLGVPIIQNRKVLGVLVVRQEAKREFVDDEVTFLFTLAAQLAGAITYAQASGELDALTEPSRVRPLSGRAARRAPGSASDTAWWPIGWPIWMPSRIAPPLIRKRNARRFAQPWQRSRMTCASCRSGSVARSRPRITRCSMRCC